LENKQQKKHETQTISLVSKRIINQTRIYTKKMSDSSYSAATRHRTPYSTSGRPPTLDIVDDDWAADTLPDDEVDCARQEAAIAPLLGELDISDAVSAIAGNPGSAQSEKRRREENRWNDLALDRFGGSNGSNNTDTNAHHQ
jgi:hypothetical protein